MVLRAETHFDVQNVEFQGSWFKTKPNYTHLVGFTKTTAIPNLRLNNNAVLNLPDVSLYFEHLDEDTQGEYELQINIIFPESPSLVAVTKTVTVTVSGKSRVSVFFGFSYKCKSVSYGSPFLPDNKQIML